MITGGSMTGRNVLIRTAERADTERIRAALLRMKSGKSTDSIPWWQDRNGLILWDGTVMTDDTPIFKAQARAHNLRIITERRMP